MADTVDPRALRPGDLVSPLFNPTLRIVVTEVALSTLGNAVPRHNPALPASTPVRLIFGTREHTDEPTRILVGLTDQVRRHRRPGEFS